MIYKIQAQTVTEINNTEWTLLNQSQIKFDAINVFERSGELKILVAFNANPGNDYLTIPAYTEYDDALTHDGGVYAKVADAATATVEFISKTKLG